MSVFSALERAWQLYRLQRPAAAIEATMEYLAKYPESAEAHCILALCHGKEKCRKESLQAAQAAVGYKPDWSYAHYVLSLTSFWFDDYDLSLRALSEALRINPEDPDYHDLLASIHYQKGMYRTARECAENGLTYDPEHVGCLFRRGACLYEEKRTKEAEEAFLAALRIDSEHFASQGLLGVIENNRGNFKRALPLLSNALKTDPRWQYVQDAWRESLRGTNLLYGTLAKCKIMFSTWPWLLALYLSVTIAFLIYSPGKFSGSALAGYMTLAVVVTTILLLFSIVVIESLLGLLRVYLHWRLYELKHSFDWHRFRKKHRKSMSVGIIMALIGIFIIIGLLTRK